MSDRKTRSLGLTRYSDGGPSWLTFLGHTKDSLWIFTDRARSVQPAFELTTDNAQALAHVCIRLDGIPLAIELAASRLNVISVQQIHARLANQLGLLTGGSRTALPRQQTLRAAID